MPDHPDYPQENAYLQDTLAYLRDAHADAARQKGETDALVTYALAHYNSDNAEQFVELALNTHRQDALARKVAETRYALQKPYFARVDFSPDDAPPERLYIGKTNLMRGLDFLILDWRAPVSGLYYEGRVGRAAYDCPDGVIAGEITLKRQYDIQQGRLLRVSDIDITTNDEFLQAALGASKDRRLKDIVTTIQAEQNRVIRAPLYTPLIVQGAAGGGKTTIALHRIAYLLYNHDKLQARQVMIMAPNRYFLSYISDVLPDLGVERVKQTTFEEFAAECIALPARWRVNPAAQTLADAVNRQAYATEAMTAAGLKGGLPFMTLIDRYAAYIEGSLAPREDFVLEGYELFTHEALEALFLQEYAHLPAAKRAAEIAKHLRNTLNREKPLILRRIEADYDGRLDAVKRRMGDSPQRRRVVADLLDERDGVLKRVKNKSAALIRQYMKRFALEPVTAYYRRLFDEWLPTMAAGLFTQEEVAVLTRCAAPALAAHRLETEDLPPLLYMQIKLYGLGEGLDDAADMKQIVIDEAQDFSLFQFAALKALAGRASFTILGDLHQGIYAYKSAGDWEAVRRHVFAGESAYMTLAQSYRTTTEIMEAANRVIGRLPSGADIPYARPVIRHGPPVTLSVAATPADCAAAIDKKIAAYREAGHRSIAIIGKTLEACRALRQRLACRPALITGQEEQYEGGLLLVPVYLVKGLEFDAVVIADVSAETYRAEEALDIRLLYVAMTRALHELALFAVGAASELVI